MKVRDEVKWFSEKMEEKLQLNDHKPGWRNDSILCLYSRLKEELDEFLLALSKDDSKEILIGELADVANFAMFIADIIKRR